MLQRREFCVVALLSMPVVFAATGRAADAIYVGAEKCKNCHSTPSHGDQFDKWKAEKHAQAFQVLLTDAAKTTAKAKGIDDPSKAAACLKCHVTAYELPAAQKDKSFDMTLGVQCETCHGPGSKHVMARLLDDTDDTAANLKELPKSEIIGAPTADTCFKCHNKESPNYVPFAFNKFLPVIAHLDPRKKRPADYLEKIPADPRDDPKAVTPKK